MIKLQNQYAVLHRFLAKPENTQGYEPEKFMLPALELQAVAYRDGARHQLAACAADLRNWAEQYRVLGKEELYRELKKLVKLAEEKPGLEIRLDRKQVKEVESKMRWLYKLLARKVKLD